MADSFIWQLTQTPQPKFDCSCLQTHPLRCDLADDPFTFTRTNSYCSDIRGIPLTPQIFSPNTQDIMILAFEVAPTIFLFNLSYFMSSNLWSSMSRRGSGGPWKILCFFTVFLLIAVLYRIY